MSTKLPKLNDSQTGARVRIDSASQSSASHRKSTRMANKAPFKAPTDDEVFLYREKERIMEEEQKKQQRV